MNGKKNLKNKEVNIFWKKLSKFLLIIFPCLLIWTIPVKSFAAFNSSYIIPDDQFIAKEAMNETGIQSFLESKNSYLKDYYIPNDVLIGPNNDVNVKDWRASRVIYNVSQWYNMNPQTILVTLQKEQSLVTTTTLNQYGLDWAMGYGVPDSGDRDYRFQGFAMQVDWGTWQLRWNFDKAIAQDPLVSPYWVGNTVSIDGVATYIGNGATASLYRYTPHFHGNENFYTIFYSWFVPYDYQFVSAVNPPAFVGAGQYAAARVVLRNSGSATWYNETQNPLTTPTRLAVTEGQALASDDGSWIGISRIKMTSDVVASGQDAIFDFTIKIPQAPGTYTIKFFPLVENTRNLPDIGMQFVVTAPDWLSYRFMSAINPPGMMSPGQVSDVSVVLQNTGSAIWNSDSVDPLLRPVRLAILSGSPAFYESSTWIETSRIRMTTPTVLYGQLAYFNFKVKAPDTPSIYTIRFVPVIENLSFLTDIGMEFSSFVVGSVPVYRFWSDQKQGHFYTASLEEKNFVVNNYSGIWRYEGIAFYAYNASINGSVPVYRFWSDQKQGHFYTASWEEKNFVTSNYSNIWKLEGIQFYVLNSNNPGSGPTYRFWSDQKQKHFYTTSEGEKDYIIRTYPSSVWRYEGIAWYTPGS